jgi:hypothetical protein
MAIVDAIVMELEQEACTTRRVLERVPEDKFAWKPHPKSFSLGQLSIRIAGAQKVLAEMVAKDAHEMAMIPPQEPTSRKQLLQTILSIPRVACIRSILMNHIIHHPGSFRSTCDCLTCRCPRSTGPARTKIRSGNRPHGVAWPDPRASKKQEKASFMNLPLARGNVTLKRCAQYSQTLCTCSPQDACS